MNALSTRQNFVIYSAVSAVLTSISVYNVFSKRPNFYSSFIALSDGIHVLVLGNFVIVTTIFISQFLIHLLFGELRIIERKHIYERSWITITNLLVALAVFKNENNLLIGSLILGLLFMKVFHWILIDRIDYIFQTMSSIRQILFSKCSFNLFLFLIIDFNIVSSLIDHSFQSSPDVFVIFGFDFTLLFFDLFEQFGKSTLNILELQYLNHHPDEELWEQKTIYLKIFEIIMAFLRVAIFLFLFAFLIGPYRMPVTFMRDAYLSISKLIIQIKDLLRYLKASKELDSRLVDATEADLEHDNLCIICREDMSTLGVLKGSRHFPKKLLCGHVIHMGCLKSWLERSQSCPMCRSPVFNDALNAPHMATEGNQDQNRNQNNNNNNNNEINDNNDDNNDGNNNHINHDNANSNNNNTNNNAQQQQQQQGLPFVRNFFRNRRANVTNVPNRSDSLNNDNSDSRINTSRVLDQIPQNVFHTTNNFLSAGNSNSQAVNYGAPSISLPSNSIILPPDWSLLPLQPIHNIDGGSEPEEYALNLNSSTTAKLRIVNNINSTFSNEGRQIEFIRKPESTSAGEEMNINNDNNVVVMDNEDEGSSSRSTGNRFPSSSPASPSSSSSRFRNFVSKVVKNNTNATISSQQRKKNNNVVEDEFEEDSSEKQIKRKAEEEVILLKNENNELLENYKKLKLDLKYVQTELEELKKIFDSHLVGLTNNSIEGNETENNNNNQENQNNI
ncbi:hypothetical protein PACTADRAFT_55980 [Pachysolen tannophilus NRRL Y-2460]|uniref:RING-type E3 ubiquitin transferase n=1 Tax=Pachysolen tannophilus NRRL Y-2460 TaxID=669874 RepID=A0A1E4U0D1_PACTA|nr:hypothetical protein PACTADRAFT_55980 [Pachysolen tannophilus NRRL Y-2460]